MAVLLSDLYRETQQRFKMKLIAGSSGLARVVRWVYLAEDIEYRSFIEKDELVISTAFAVSIDPDWLKPFIRAMIEEGTSGVILNVGKYVKEEDITADIVALCNENQFPLLTIPWEIHLSQITQDYWDRIVTDRRNMYDLGTAVRFCLRNASLGEESIEVFQERHWHPADRYGMAAIAFSCEPAETAQCRGQIRQQAAYYPSIYRTDILYLEYNELILLVWHDVEETSIEGHVRSLLESCISIPALTDVRIGVSQVQTGLDRLPVLYRQALAAMGSTKHGVSPLCYFRDLGSYQILLEVSDHDLLRDYYRRYIGVLEDYDRKHKSNYLETLECYLNCGQHLAKAAETMICHRNTVNYRVNKIRDLLQSDLNDAEVKFQLTLAINIRNFLSIYEESDQYSS